MTKRSPAFRSLASAMRHGLVICLGLLAPFVAQAQDEQLVAGWDFSQYSNEGFLTLDGVTLNGATVDANHSDFDPTGQTGIESNAFGRMYLNGSFGSSVAILDPNFLIPDPFRPFAATLGAGSLVSNVDQAFQGYGSGAACTIQQLELMPFTNCSDYAMVADAPVSVVFAADRSAAEGASGDWAVSFAGRTYSEGETPVAVQFSTDGSSYANVGTAAINAADTEYTFPLGGASSATAYVRLVFPTPATPGASAIIDNFGIALPEPAHGGLAAALALAALRRSRRRS